MKIIIKIGSSCILKNNEINKSVIENLIKDISILKKEDHQIYFISSGAIALGEVLNCNNLNIQESKKNLFNLGWSLLTKIYYDLCLKNNLYPLLKTITKESLKRTIKYILTVNNAFIPILNEDDFLNQDDPYYDNDHLTYEISKIINPDIVIFLTSTNGVLTEENGNLIKKLNINSNFNIFNKTGVGRGGIESKINYANKIFLNNSKVFIANGFKENILLDILSQKENYTEIC